MTNLETENKTDKILVVDDLPDNLELVEAILEGSGYEITCVQSGEAALDAVYRTLPDLVLLDVMMPKMDGYEVTRRLREDKSLPYIPILLTTAHNQPSVVKGLDAGADDFIRKPVEIDELMARVRSLLRLKNSIDEQVEILRQRDDFVARLTHDLRTPLVAANRVLQFCLEGAFGQAPDDMQIAIANILDNNKNLLQMTNTLLEVYRHEAGHKSLTPATIDLRELVENVASELKPLSSEKGLELKLSSSADRSYRVIGDRLELRRIITNILSNAIKFTDQGFIEVRLETSSQELAGSSQSSWVQVAIQDTGPGIPPEEQVQIFEWFRPGKHRRSGSGLGLHLSRRIAEMHSGSLTVKSQLGEGSCFILALPMAEAS
ncbi:MAG: hybrid sensor histidine kinase/response regulator [Leptolyngbya sp. SIO4C5]|uniref:hybrid sensor histidine kinase/response regulator n=1 Tax=Sphaerothrix gracilis TaxID=3151835 RepID=UPI0013C13983|nr:hybrid sensor histidine kinase/response regulator [Leptolyngbya sp. SIO4C5]